MALSLSSLTNIKINLFSPDGSSIELSILKGSIISSLKNMLATSLDTVTYLIDIYLQGSEEKLLDNYKLEKDCSLFVLFTNSFGWVNKGEHIALSNKSLVATHTKQTGEFNQIYQKVTLGEILTNGRYYYEVSETNKLKKNSFWTTMVGCFKLYQDPEKEGKFLPIDYNRGVNSNDAYLMNCCYGSLWGPNANNIGHQDCNNQLKANDMLGILINLDEGWIRFYRNRQRYGSVFYNVQGPLICGAIMRESFSSLLVYKGATIPEEETISEDN